MFNTQKVEQTKRSSHKFGKERVQMTEKKPPHEQLTDRNNGLSSTQEVLYQEEYRKADKAAKNDEKNRNR
jgi:YfhE-like protein